MFCIIRHNYESRASRATRFAHFRGLLHLNNSRSLVRHGANFAAALHINLKLKIILKFTLTPTLQHLLAFVERATLRLRHRFWTLCFLAGCTWCWVCWCCLWPRLSCVPGCSHHLTRTRPMRFSLTMIYLIFFAIAFLRTFWVYELNCEGTSCRTFGKSHK